MNLHRQRNKYEEAKIPSVEIATVTSPVATLDSSRFISGVGSKYEYKFASRSKECTEGVTIVIAHSSERTGFN